MHGAGGTAAAWDAQRMAFPRSVAVTLPGHGDGAAPLAGIPAYAAWLHTTIHARAWLPAVLAGQSMGGAVALRYAIAHPDDLAALVLLATGARLRVEPAILDGLRRDFPRTIAGLVQSSLAPSAAPVMIQRVTAAMHLVPPDVTVRDFEACDAFDVMARLGEIRLPTLIVAGREDRMTPPKYAEFLHARIAGSRLVWIEDAGHLVHIERPRAVNNAISAFLSEAGVRV